MKMSRRERKAYNAGYNDGHIEGYNQGLEDGNPFMTVAKAITKLTQSIAETVTSGEFKKALEAMQQDDEEGDCNYCKHKNNNSTEYPCDVCGERGPYYRDFWEEAENNEDNDEDTY